MDRLGREAIHARLEAALLERLRRVGSQGCYESRRLLRFHQSYLLCCLEPIHDGHVAVHEDKLVVAPVQGTDAGVGSVQLQALLYHGYCLPAVGGFV